MRQTDDRSSFEKVRDILVVYGTYEPIQEPPARGAARKIGFDLACAGNTEIMPVTDPDDRCYPNLVAVPSNQKGTLKID